MRAVLPALLVLAFVTLASAQEEVVCTEFATDMVTGLDVTGGDRGDGIWMRAVVVTGGQHDSAALQMPVALPEHERLWLHLRDLLCGVTTLAEPVVETHSEPHPAAVAPPHPKPVQWMALPPMTRAVVTAPAEECRRFFCPD